MERMNGAKLSARRMLVVGGIVDAAPREAGALADVGKSRNTY